MNLLFDQNISFRIVKKISERYPDARQVKSLGLQDSTDLHIWNYAKSNGYTLVTFDLDFQDISNLRGHPPKIILLRTGNTSTDHIAQILLQKFRLVSDFISSKEYEALSCLQIVE